jgi:acetolactate synthase-1/2/3 large subunit
MVADALRAEGVHYLFGLPGNPVHLYDALYDLPEVKPILVRHEVSGGFMATAYALVSGEPAVCFASPGPGVANLVPALLEALATCAPVIAPCTGVDMRKEGKGAFQETDHVGMMAPVTKWATRVIYPARIPWAMRRAFFLATNGQPGPVFLEIPPEVGTARAEALPYQPAERGMRSAGDPARVEAAARLLAEARHPLLVAGGGARSSGAHQALRALAELLGMPVLTTPSGRGILTEDHPLAFGQVGLYRTQLGVEAVDRADLIITVGSRNEEFQTAAWTHMPRGARFVQIDISVFEIGRNWIPDAAIVGDARLVVEQLLNLLRENVRPAWQARAVDCSEAKQSYRSLVVEECLRDTAPLKTKRVLYELNEVFGANTILVHENGAQDLWSYYSPYCMVLDLNGDVAPGEQTCMGFGVAGAIGAKLARPDKKVVCVTGDGAFQMASQELPTAVQYHAPVTWVILNNNGLGWPKYGQRQLGGRYIAVDFEAQPDFVGMARACGCHAERVENVDHVRAALERAMRANLDGTPAIVDFVVDPWDLPEGFHRFHESRYG